MKNSWPSRVVLLAMLLIPVSGIAQPSVDALLDQTYRAAYNLDHEEAMAAVQKALPPAPQMSAAHRALAGVLFLRIAFLRGAVTLDHYFSGMADGRLALP